MTPVPSPIDSTLPGVDDKRLLGRRRPVEDPARWMLEVRLGAGVATGGLHKVLSVLHSRGVGVSHLQYLSGPDGSAVMTVGCIAGVAHLETVRRSVENAVQVVSVRVYAAPLRPRGRYGRRRSFRGG